MKSAKTSVLSRLKNIVTKTKRLISWRRSIKDEHMTADDAQDIQHDVFTHTQNIRHTQYTPPYIELAAQLLVSEQQIFEAAATKLTIIAQTRRKYAPEIKSIFAEIVANHKLSEEKIDYLNRKLKQI